MHPANVSVSSTVTTARKRYVVRTALFLGGYIAVNVSALTGAFDDISRLGGLALGLIVGAPVAGQLWATLAYMAASDEFVRALTAKRFIVASGLSIAVFSAWGFMESYGDAPHAPGWLIYPLFWGFFGLVSPFTKSTR